MPWTKDNPPKVALNWTPDEQAKCISAGNAALAKGATDRQAIFACVAAAKRSEQSSDTFLIPFSKALRDDILIFPVGKFYRDGGEREFTREMGAQMVANFRANILERKNDGWLPINAEHMRQHGRLADIAMLYQDDDGDVRGKPHDPDGKLGPFDYFSPEVRWEWTHPTSGKEYKTVLMGGGATNYPFFLGKMALQSDEVAVAKSADPPLVWSGSEWEVFSAEPGLMDRVVDAVCKVFRGASNVPKINESQIQQDNETVMPLVPERYAPAFDSHGSLVVDDSHPLVFSNPSPDTNIEYKDTTFTHTVQFAAADSDKRIMTGVVWEPDKSDMHGHIVSDKDVEAGAHDFMSRLQLDAHHNRLIQSEEVRIVESWIQREPVTWKMSLPDGGVRTTEVAPGSWCMSVQVVSDELWNEVLSGDITGFSPVGVAVAQELEQNT